MKASDIMTKEVLMIHSLATVAEAIAMMQDKKLRSLIVEPSDDSNDYGIVTETDIVYSVTAQELDPEEVKVREIMTRPCIAIDPDLTIPAVARLFTENGIEKAPVIKDRLLGVVSATDILMKTKVAQLSSGDILSQKIGEALLHSRIYRDPEEQIDHDAEVAWNVVEEFESEEYERKMNM